MKPDLTFDPELMDIKFYRDDMGTHFNIKQKIKHHSPTGMEWGYAGSGPADFALNILALFLPANGKQGDEQVQCWRGKCSQQAYELHQAFKFDVICNIERDGYHVIEGDFIRDWIKQKILNGN